jgi:hypothetical protein
MAPPRSARSFTTDAAAAENAVHETRVALAGYPHLPKQPNRSTAGMILSECAWWTLAEIERQRAGSGPRFARVMRRGRRSTTA